MPIERLPVSGSLSLEKASSVAQEDQNRLHHARTSLSRRTCFGLFASAALQKRNCGRRSTRANITSVAICAKSIAIALRTCTATAIDAGNTRSHPIPIEVHGEQVIGGLQRMRPPRFLDGILVE